MTEAEWLAQRANPQWMLDHVRDTRRAARTKAGRRRLRLISCGCCRLIWSHLNEPRLRSAVEVAEWFADGLASARQLQLASASAEPRGARVYSEDAPGAQESTTIALAWATAREKPVDAAFYAMCWPMPLAGHCGPPNVADALICDTFRDIFGNPFRPVSFSPEWRTDTAVALARTMYESRDFSAMPILADALQDAGCDQSAILDHCRTEQVHVRGCWVVDLVLGKE